MTEYEMASLYNETAITSITYYALFLSFMSGFLVTANFVAHTLSRGMVVVVVGIFSALGSAMAVQLAQWAAIADAVRGQLRTFAQSGKGLAWHPIANTTPPEWYLNARPWMVGIVLATTMVGSIYFFFHCRRVNRKSEIEAMQPKT